MQHIQAAPTTPLSDYFVDFILAEMSGAEVKTFLYLHRHTVGRKCSGVKLTIPQIANGIAGVDRGTGLNRSSVTLALQALQQLGLIRRTPDGVFSLRQLEPEAQCETK